MRIDRYLATPAEAPKGFFAHPLWALGFRPFFLMAGLLATLWLALWLYVFVGQGPLPLAYDPVAWHSHEMIFGFATAVLAGFLLTAARNWTRQPTPTGAWLAALVLVWFLGRVVMVVGAGLPPVVVALVDVAFLPAFAFAIARPLWRARNKRNYVFPALLLALAGVDLAFHLAPTFRRVAAFGAIDVLVCFLVIMGGRVIPSFTRNALPQARVVIRGWLDAITIAATLAYPVVHLATGVGLASDVAALVAGVLNLARLAGWDSLATRRTPILWVLHVGYAWVGVGLVMLGLSAWVPALGGSAPLHALTVGALGTLTLGMMARVSLGHTGRPLVVARTTTVAFALVTLAALTRVVLPLASPDLYVTALVAAGSLWSIAFLLFVVVYWPILTRPRVDGAPG